ncbi:MAG: hypothetical protein ACRDZO_08255 [Egibacteraceae bacterium]
MLELLNPHVIVVFSCDDVDPIAELPTFPPERPAEDGGALQRADGAKRHTGMYLHIGARTSDRPSTGFKNFT